MELIANGLGIEAWQLLRKMTHTERLLYSSVEQAFRDLLNNATTAAKVTAAASGPDAEPQYITRRPPLPHSAE